MNDISFNLFSNNGSLGFRRPTHQVQIGSTPLGGDNPIRIQSMTNTSTMDTEGSVEQCIRIIEAGGEYVRLTAQGVREAENLRNIRNELRRRGYNTPLVADIHFNANAAFAAAATVEKVRINPGNFVDTARKFKKIEYSDEEYFLEIQKIRERFVPFLNVCRENNTAVRIGVNHGSLSDRIMSRYGDTVDGMVESCMEFLRICVEEKFFNVVVSMKASSTRVMVGSVRKLVCRMNKENMTFPLHLGVTEAGDGEDGRIKSAVGIGALLYEGVGDTIRVSLSEEPEAEIPVAKELVAAVKGAKGIEGFTEIKENRRVPVVVADREIFNADLRADLVFDGSSLLGQMFIPLVFKDIDEKIIVSLKENPATYILLSSETGSIFEQKSAIYKLREAGVRNPIILRRHYAEKDCEKFILHAAADCGLFFIDSLADGLFLTADSCDTAKTVEVAFGILQAAGARVSKTEYISCPGCGRTLFDLQTTLKRVKAATQHLKGLKIGVMGCIVNGPGEMADADYGYVGAGVGRVSLYKGKECVKKNIPEAEAVDELLKIIEH